MSKQDAQKARSSYHSSENAAGQVNTGVTFTATGEQHEYIAEPDGQLDRTCQRERSPQAEWSSPIGSSGRTIPARRWCSSSTWFDRRQSLGHPTDSWVGTLGDTVSAFESAGICRAANCCPY